MNGERLRVELEHALRGTFRLERMSAAEWNSRTKGPKAQDGSLEDEGKLYFPIRSDSKYVTLLTTDSGWLSESERRLIELIVAARTVSESKSSPVAEKDRYAALLRQWIEDAEAEEEDQDPPEELAGYSALYSTKVPFLLYGEYDNGSEQHDEELKKLLESFFDVEMTLIPLRDKEWLVLGSESLLEDHEDDAGDAEGTEERLSSLCMGLHAMLSQEGAGECHVAVYYPIVPAKSLPQAVEKLREAMTTGRMQRVGQYVHLPWDLYLDQLLSSLSNADRTRFIEQVFKRKDLLLDAETVTTLETFFELDCNVSETAKKLFIHRNTLLYRLDKFRQESGLDVRTFNQAVHVKIALQLYKVTKRP